MHAMCARNLKGIAAILLGIFGKQKSLGAVMEEEKWTFRRCVTSDSSHGQLDCCSVVMADESGVTLALPATLYSYMDNNIGSKM